MKTLSIRDIIGPIMIGPSSSHTAGALRIALMTHRLLEKTPSKVHFKLYGSFAHTYQGHGTDRALLGGILGMNPDDERIRNSFELAREAGIDFAFIPITNTVTAHSNTVDIEIFEDDNLCMSIRGESIGGGAAHITRINGVDVLLDGEYSSLVIRQQDTPGVLAHITHVLSEAGINIATTKLFREQKGEIAYTIIETDNPLSQTIATLIAEHPSIHEVRIIPSAVQSSEAAPQMSDACSLELKSTKSNIRKAQQALSELNFENGAQLLDYCETHSIPLSKAMCLRERAHLASLGITLDDTRSYLRHVIEVMRQSATKPFETPQRSMGGLIGGEAYAVKKLNTQTQQARALTGLMATGVSYALAVLETNACMGKIVAAPTAGSAGVLPALLLSLQDEYKLDDEELVNGLANASAIGYIITRNACVSGAEGGCQAEVGSAAAMAASAAVELLGGSPRQCFAAASNALINMMGLVCDPIAGLVEAPCQKRNASGLANALVAAHLALAGIENLVPFDQTVEAMRRVGCSLPFELRESALGGIAATAAACDFCVSRSHCEIPCGCA